MRVVYMYHESDPLHGSVVPGSLPNTRLAFKGYKPLSITQRQPQEEIASNISLGSLLASSSATSSLPSTASAQLTVSPSQSSLTKLHVFELLNEDVKLPAMETLYWCKVFEFQEFAQKQHLVKVSYLQPLCQGYSGVFSAFHSEFHILNVIFERCDEATDTVRFECRPNEYGNVCNLYCTLTLRVAILLCSPVRHSKSFISAKLIIRLYSFCYSLVVIAFILFHPSSVWLFATMFYGGRKIFDSSIDFSSCCWNFAPLRPSMRPSISLASVHRVACIIHGSAWRIMCILICRENANNFLKMNTMAT